jgi:hypothetical protein
MRTTTKAKAPAGTGASHRKYFDQDHSSRDHRRTQRSLRELVEAAVVARREVGPEDRAAIADAATAFAELVVARAGKLVGRRERRGAGWRQACVVAAATAVYLEVARRGMAERYPPLSTSTTAPQDQAHSLVHYFLAEFADATADLSACAAAVAVVLAATLAPAPTCRRAARRRRRRRAAATCRAARAARKGGGCHGRPHTSMG